MNEKLTGSVAPIWEIVIVLPSYKIRATTSLKLTGRCSPNSDPIYAK